MWSWSLAKITTVKHHIDLKADSRSAFRHSYRANLRTRELQCRDIDQMLKEGGFKPTMGERASLVVLASRKEEKVRFYLDYRKLNVIDFRDTYLLLEWKNAMTCCHLQKSSLHLIAAPRAERWIHPKRTAINSHFPAITGYAKLFGCRSESGMRRYCFNGR